MSELKYCIDLLLFPNRKEDEIANFFSITNDFLWRRDREHLVAYHLTKKIQGNWDYPVSALEDNKEIKDVNVDTNGVLLLSFLNGESKKVSPVSTSFEPNSIKTLFLKKPTSEFELSSKFLSRQLSTLQRKLLNKNIQLDSATIEIDLKNKLLVIKELGESKEIPHITVKDPFEGKLIYSFSLFKDLFINSSKIGEKILFKVNSPYYTVAFYGNNLYSVLTHKKDS